MTSHRGGQQSTRRQGRVHHLQQSGKASSYLPYRPIAAAIRRAGL